MKSCECFGRKNLWNTLETDFSLPEKWHGNCILLPGLFKTYHFSIWSYKPNICFQIDFQVE
ncbi:hypothetical protein HMPREF9442_01285 [Paraprevotella xylaniphila YIT 11841]|uniref:Uncharacterized protein n=1 Tax=Paraprevotella xylaniphila YIT 11841 TaxID=762982 RepID=F3QSX0_9BACT|nr:hypothetical protein HMPREF9442_01285 [Paraprevotella xylaniphila YIT 11841]